MNLLNFKAIFFCPSKYEELPIQIKNTLNNDTFINNEAHLGGGYQIIFYSF